VLPAPTEDRELLDAYFASRDRALRTAAGIQAALAVGDIAQAEAIDRASSDAAAQEQRIAEQYGFKECL